MAGAQPHHCQCQQHLQEPLQLLPQRSTALISIDEDEPLIVVADSGDILQIDLSEYDPRSTVPPIAIAPITIPSAPLAGPIKTEKPSGSLFKSNPVVMGFLKQFRSRSKLKDGQEHGQAHSHTHTSNGFLAPPDPNGVDYISNLGATILTRIFGFIAPHTKDKSYESCENALSSLPDDCCVLCDLRQLSYCASVQRSWYETVSRQLYGTVLIYEDHYPEGCYPEDAAAKREKRNRRKPNNDGYESRYDEKKDHLIIRANLLTNALRNNPSLAAVVEYIKLQYNFREVRRGEIARLAQACPNVRFVDVGSDFFRGDIDCRLLRRELEVNCPRLSMMKYMKGSAAYFHQLAVRNPWQYLETLTLEDIQIDQTTFRNIIASLPALYNLSLTNLEGVTDEVFTVAAGVPAFPAIPELELHRMPEITTAGLIKYLSGPSVRPTLKSLTLHYTGVKIETLHHILAAADRLRSLTVIDRVSKSLPLEQPPILRSSSLQTLHYEIKVADKPLIPNPAETYHAYLANSILGGGLRALVTIYCLDQQMTLRLSAPLLAPPKPGFLEAPSRRLVSSVSPETISLINGMEIYIMSEKGWNFNMITNPVRNDPEYNDTPIPRDHPVSPFNKRWSTNARRSIVVPNGAGGYLPVAPVPGRCSSSVGPRPGSSNSSAGGNAFLSPEDAIVPPPPRHSWFSPAVGRPGSQVDMWR